MFKKPFNRTIGEQRECKICNETFHAMKPIWKCNKCVNATQKIIESAKRAKYNKKDQYPFNTRTNEASIRFSRIHSELSKAWKQYDETGDKSYITAHYDKQLKEIEENGILTWITDRRSADALREKRTKTHNMMKKDYPDTRQYYEE